MTYEQLQARAGADGMTLLGGFHPENDPHLPDWCETLVLLGPAPNFWQGFSQSPEWQDGANDPMDRWSTRVIGKLAKEVNADALFPFGGPPFKPFFTWALNSGEAWQSPVNLLIHGNSGLMVSYRGALALRDRLTLPEPPNRPCDTCAQPCLSACTPRALTAEGYDVPACKAHLSREEGRENMALGCSVRRACPVSQSYARMSEQSAYHMRMFMGEKR